MEGLAVEQLIPLLTAPLVSVLVEAGKRVPVIPFDGGRRASIVLALVIVSLAVRLALAYLGGQLGAFDWQAELKILADALLSALAAAGAYSLVRKQG